MEGIIVLDKPQDFTSFDAVAVVRGLTRERRIGHTGTLDPMATGVLPLLLGRATKAVSLLPETAKTYEASFRFGEAYTTGDVTGEVIKTDETPVLRAALETALDSFRGDILQVPPMYSAVSVNGQRLYKLARQGIEVEREARPVHIAELTLLEYNENGKNRQAARHVLERHVYPHADRRHCPKMRHGRCHDGAQKNSSVRLYARRRRLA